MVISGTKKWVQEAGETAKIFPVPPAGPLASEVRTYISPAMSCPNPSR